MYLCDVFWANLKVWRVSAVPNVELLYKLLAINKIFDFTEIIFTLLNHKLKNRLTHYSYGILSFLGTKVMFLFFSTMTKCFDRYDKNYYC